ncbi:FKBP-type peptidyl-prolyl cis-trans isomerase [Streptomyces xinghaiensis]|uniref:FKBP-type peptidyl-prolyl cis-trans isomerase n=1 Tax=Streptomyces xinghaiensis TaxID=1038928 RepID=UPI002E0EB415|nr:FKBP-type peptidyl-prolyl cis-trans isomerase [Streptomyces xinghaiensis]
MLPTVSGKFGRNAIIEIPKAKPSGKFVVTTALKGRGRKARKNDIAVVNYTAKAWKRGTALPSTYGKGRSPKVFSVGNGAVIPALDRAVHGQRAGSRVLVVAPPAAAYGKTGNAKLGVAGTDTVVFVVDIEKVIAADSAVRGRQQDVSDALPQVRADGSATAIVVPDTAAPKRLVSRTLIDGSDLAIKTGQTVVYRHAGTVWSTNRGKEHATLFDSTWPQGPTSVIVGRGNLIEGLDQALVGAKVGSRILLVIPPGLAYGAQAQKHIPAKSTLIFVVDILAAV